MTDRHLPNWLKAYLVYTAESESPQAFHLWVGTSVIAGALERQTYFDMGYFTLYPNLYIVLVAPPGRCKKSTAMRIGRKLLATVNGIKFTTDSISRERLIQDLAQSYKDGQSAMTAYSSEFATLLTTSGMDMVVFLTDIYDSPNEWVHSTKGGGTNKIKAPFLNLIGGTTPDWMARAMPLDTVGIGLTSRIIFTFEDTPRIKKPFPRLSIAQKELEHLLAEDLVKISMISGQYELDEAATKYYEEWYVTKEETNTLTDPRLSGYSERKPMHLLKLAMIMQASKDNSLVITLDTLQETMSMMSDVETKMPRVFAFIGKNPLNADIEEALAVILANPEGTSRQELLTMFRHSVRKDELLEVLDTLVESGDITLKNDGRYYAIRKPKQ